MTQTLGYAMLAFATLIAVGNFYLSFLRPPIYWWFGWECQNVTGIPMVGTLSLIAALALLEWTLRLWIGAVALCVIDTCGLAWFCAVMGWEVLRGRTP